jgi:hypothetical protein
MYARNSITTAAEDNEAAGLLVDALITMPNADVFRDFCLTPTHIERLADGTATRLILLIENHSFSRHPEDFSHNILYNRLNN